MCLHFFLFFLGVVFRVLHTFEKSTHIIASFNLLMQSTQWRSITVSQGAIPDRKQITRAVTGNNDKIYIFGGGLTDNPGNYYSYGMNIFDTTNKFWSNGPDGSVGRDGHTATFLPDTGEIIYIGGMNNVSLIDITNVCIILH